jgi:hypothetical protein
VTVKRFITAIPFDGTKIFTLYFFVGGKAVVAGQALPATADDGPVFPRARIDHFVFFDITFWAFHTTPCVELTLQVGGMGSIKFYM